MNTAIVLLVVCAAAVEVLAGRHGGGHGEMMKQFAEECITFTGADPELIKASKHGGSADENVKCFYACMGQKFGMMNEDGTVNKEKFNSAPVHVPEEQKEEFIQARAKCAEITGDNKCNTAWNVWECLRPLMKPHHRKHRRE